MHWIEKDNALHGEIKTSDFAEALAAANRIGILAERMNHHPDLELGWGYIRIHLRSHDAGKVTNRDRALAKGIDELFQQSHQAH